MNFSDQFLRLKSESAKLSLKGFNAIAMMIHLAKASDGIYPGKMSELLETTNSNVTQISQRLGKMGLITNEPTQYNGLTRKLQLTDKGRDLLTKILPCQSSQ